MKLHLHSLLTWVYALIIDFMRFRTRTSQIELAASLHLLGASPTIVFNCDFLVSIFCALTLGIKYYFSLKNLFLAVHSQLITYNFRSFGMIYNSMSPFNIRISICLVFCLSDDCLIIVFRESFILYKIEFWQYVKMLEYKVFQITTSCLGW